MRGLRLRIASARTLAALAAMALLTSSPVRAGISLDAELASPGSLDVELRWEGEGVGPFTLRAWNVPEAARIVDALRADPDGVSVMMGIPASPLLLPGAGLLPGNLGARAYQIVDESDGGCSNMAYIAVRRSLVAEDVNVLAFPERSAVRTLGQVMDQYPVVRRVELVEAGACRRSALERVAGGRRGLDAFIPAGKAVQITLSRDNDLVVVGASASRHDGTPVDFRPGPCPMPIPNIHFSSTTFGVEWRSSDDLLCGREGIDWSDPDGNGFPDACPNGLFDGVHGIMVTKAGRDGDSPETQRAFEGEPFMGFKRDRFTLDPIAGWSATPIDTQFRPEGDRVPPRFLLGTTDAGAPAACRCADGDGDGDDDCTERLMGTDPADPASRGPDFDRDGVRDTDDDCPAIVDPLQFDGDGDGFGDACDPDPLDPLNLVIDPDSDRIFDGIDLCPDTFDPLQLDDDADDIGNACDLCPFQASNQVDGDGDRIGDECDPCPLDPSPDVDRDGACSDDNCPLRANGDQGDADSDGFGDACECASVPDLLPEVEDLRMVRVGGGSLLRRLHWRDDRADLPGGVESYVFDVRGGLLDVLHEQRDLRQGLCVKSAVRDAAFVEGPVSGSHWYIVRLRSACAFGELGEAGPPGGPNPRDLIERAPGWFCP